MAHLALDPGWVGEVREIGEVVDGCVATDGLHGWNMRADCFGRGRRRDSAQ